MQVTSSGCNGLGAAFLRLANRTKHRQRIRAASGLYIEKNRPMASSCWLHEVRRSHFGKQQAPSRSTRGIPIGCDGSRCFLHRFTLGLWLNASIIVLSACHRPAGNCPAVKALGVIALAVWPSSRTRFCGLPGFRYCEAACCVPATERTYWMIPI